MQILGGTETLLSGKKRKEKLCHSLTYSHWAGFRLLLKCDQTSASRGPAIDNYAKCRGPDQYVECMRESKKVEGIKREGGQLIK